MTFVIQILFSGIAIGSIYALVALGLSITFATSRTVNFSQGQAAMLGAVLFFSATQTEHQASWIGYAAVIIAGAAAGIFVAGVAILPFIRNSHRNASSGWLLSTIALGVVAENVALLTFGREARALASPFGQTPLFFLGAGVFPHEVFLAVVGMLLALALELVLNHSRAGVIFRAVSFDRQAAERLGINSTRVTFVAFAVSTAIAFVAGVLLAPLTNISATMGTVVGVKAFAIAAVAGMTEPRGIVLVALLYGVLEAGIGGYLDTGARDIIGFAVLIAALFVKPSGLFAPERLRAV